MKRLNKIFAVLFSILFVAGCFAGCSSSETAEEVTDETLLVAYTDENSPFIYTDKNGELTGFDVEVFKAIFDGVKNDFKNYKFVKVEPGYRIGEDTAYTDENGTDYIACVMLGGLQRDTGTFNEDCSFTENLIDNRIVTVTGKDSDIKTYADLEGKNIGVITQQARAALDDNSTIKNNCKSVKEYSDIAVALKDLDVGKLNALVTDEFSFNIVDNCDNYKVLDSELDTISYVFAFKKYDRYKDSFNEAIYELKSKDYKDKDEFTPIVEKYFGYNASNFEYTPV